MRFTCTICQRFASPTLKRVMRHIGSVHSHEPYFKVTCGIGGCPRTYVNFKSFQKHIRRVHVAMPNEIDVSSSSDHSQFDTEDYNDLGTFSVHNQPSSSSLKRNAALFLLKTKEKGRVSQATLDELVFDLTSFVQVRLDEVHQEVKSVISQSDVPVSDVATAVIERSFNKKGISRPFAGLESSYLQRKYFKEELKMLVCYNVLCGIVYFILWTKLRYRNQLKEDLERVCGEGS